MYSDAATLPLDDVQASGFYRLPAELQEEILRLGTHSGERTLRMTSQGLTIATAREAVLSKVPGVSQYPWSRRSSMARQADSFSPWETSYPT